MAVAKKTMKKGSGNKKAVSAKEASAVANLLKSQKAGANGSGTANSGAPQPKPNNNPITSDNDNDQDEDE